MMINKRLLSVVPESRKYIAANVGLQWLALVANIAMMMAIAHLLAALWQGRLQPALTVTAFTGTVALGVRFFCNIFSARMGYLSSKTVKRTLRGMIYEKLLRLGTTHQEQVHTSEVIQMAVEGVDQLETYFGAYLPQFFYALLAPLTLFGVLCSVNLPAAVVLLVCVPLIPVTIIMIQRWAKKLLSKYWGQYTALGDTFLENLQGLTTTKIYGSDGIQHEKMQEQAEHFRRITMKVLTMQLNSITVMDLIAYGGAALGTILAVIQFREGRVDLAGCLLVILLAADFFLPMRLLGSFFHIAMNGMAASDKIFHLLDLPEPVPGTAVLPAEAPIRFENLSFSYEAGREILGDLDLSFPVGSFTALVGASGCGKSTIASLLMGRHRDYTGTITLGGIPLSQIRQDNLTAHITYISHQSYLFKGTIRDNLTMAQPDATEEQLWQVLEQVRLAEFLRQEQGLNTPLLEKGANLSGGQCQRLALARALLHDSPVYIFDESTSNIDVESENDIIAQIHQLAKTKTVILISHRLANITQADWIYVLDQGRVAEQGRHRDLLNRRGIYETLWTAQQELEHYTKGASL